VIGHQKSKRLLVGKSSDNIMDQADDKSDICKRTETQATEACLGSWSFESSATFFKLKERKGGKKVSFICCCWHGNLHLDIVRAKFLFCSFRVQNARR
jgi:hypothetical protein